jgi:DNA-binding response OmpR family regulator
VLTAGPLRVDTRQMQVTVDGTALHLSPLEYRCLSYLLHHAARVVPPTELLDHLYAHDSERDLNAVEVVIARLRRKLGLNLIETRRGFGYAIAPGKAPPCSPDR